MDAHLLNSNFTKSQNEPTIYTKDKETEVLIISIYVDNMLVISNNESLINDFKQ